MLLRSVFFAVTKASLGTLETKGPSHRKTVQRTPSLHHVSDQKWRLPLEKTLDPIAGSPATGKSVAGIINLFVDNHFKTSGNEMEQFVTLRLGKYFQVGSDDWNDEAFTGRRIRWTQDSQNEPHTEVRQNKAVDELEEIPVERNEGRPPLRSFHVYNVTEAFWER